MSTVQCPLCRLRFHHAPELDLHVREDHPRPVEPEHRDTVTVPRTRHVEDVETPLDQVLAARRAREERNR